MEIILKELQVIISFALGDSEKSIKIPTFNTK